MEKSIKLVSFYLKICHLYQTELAHFVQRFSPNGHQGHITDEELLTIYFFSLIEEKKTENKAMYAYVQDYWGSWFPTLPSYQAFNQRLNRLVDIFPLIINYLIEHNNFDSDLVPILVGDACPIQTCRGNRTAKVALDLVDKTYCASKDLWYYGLKLHLLGHKLPKTMPFPQYLGITPASCADLPVMRPLLESLYDTITALDKAYCDAALEKQMVLNGSILMTPIKSKKGETLPEKQQNKAYQQAVGTAVAKVRQPIESLFNWLHQKTAIQDASKVRSSIGLKVHIWGKMAAALMLLTQF